MSYELNEEQEKALEKGWEEINDGKFHTNEEVISKMREFLLEKQHSEYLFEKAKKNYYQCITLKENYFLSDEVNVPLTSISLEETDIKITVYKHTPNTYHVDVALTLYANNEIIGKYVYTENEDDIEDSLVFY